MRYVCWSEPRSSAPFKLNFEDVHKSSQGMQTHERAHQAYLHARNYALIYRAALAEEGSIPELIRLRVGAAAPFPRSTAAVARATTQTPSRLSRRVNDLLAASALIDENFSCNMLW